MAKASINSGGAVEPVHTRTTSDTVESQVAVIGVDGSDNVVGTPAPADAKANPTNALDASAHGLMWNGATWDRVTGTTANGVDVDVTRLPALPAGTNNIGDVDVLTLPSLPAGAAIIGKVDINSAPQVAVNNVETLTDNAAFTDGTSKVFPQGYIFDESAGAALTENDIAAARVDSKRSVVNVIEDATTRGRRGIVTAEGALLNAGDTAHDGVDAGNPVKTGAKASWPAVPALVATADRTNNWSDLGGAQIVRKRPLAMYTAQYRLANATAGTRVIVTSALTANTNKQLATIYHTAASTKRVQIKFVSVNFHSLQTVAGLVEWELVTLSATTAPATGNPTITPGKNDQADSAAEAACLAVPGTQGSVVNADQPVGDNYALTLGISGTGSTANPPPNATKIVLWDSRNMGDGKDLIMRAGSAEGYAVNVRSTAASVVGFTATILFTEE